MKKTYDVFILAKGTPLSKSCLRALCESSRRVIALDGATERLFSMRIKPDMILGDLDSISASTLKKAQRRNIKIIRVTEQETSDLEKGLRYCQRRGWKRIVVAGFLGPRLDHSANAFGVFSKFPKLELTLITSESIGRIMHGRRTFTCTTKPGLQISIMPIPEARGITLTGVKWPLKNRTLKLSGNVSLSNKATSDTVTLRQTSGTTIITTTRRRSQITFQ
jgi:thiamine pyrophosphokinase